MRSRRGQYCPLNAQERKCEAKERERRLVDHSAGNREYDILCSLTTTQPENMTRSTKTVVATYDVHDPFI